MAATPRDIREALAAAIATIGGLQVTSYINANPIPPCAEVRRGPVDYHQAMADGVSSWTMLVRVYVGTVTDRGAALVLDKFTDVSGADSVKAAIEEDPTLGGLVQDLIVTTSTGEQVYLTDQAGHGIQVQMLGSEWSVTVLV